MFLEAGFGTMSAVGLQPLMCYSHPSGLYSVLKFPNVICQSGDHVTWSNTQLVAVQKRAVLRVASMFPTEAPFLCHFKILFLNSYGA